MVYSSFCNIFLSNMIMKFIYANAWRSHLLILTTVRSCIVRIGYNLQIGFAIDEHLRQFPIPLLLQTVLLCMSLYMFHCLCVHNSSRAFPQDYNCQKMPCASEALFIQRAFSIYSPNKCVGVPITPSWSTVGIGIFTNLTDMKWFFIVDFILSSYYSDSFSSGKPIMLISVQKKISWRCTTISNFHVGNGPSIGT